MGDLIDLADGKAALLEKHRAERWPVAYGPDIAKPRPPIAYVCKDLALSPGLSIFGGAGFGGKTTSLMALLLAIVGGIKAWGHFDVTPGDVTHLDFEMGPDLTYLKYQRMARHWKINLDACGRRLACHSMPKGRFRDVSPETRDELRWLFQGRKAGILDAFRGGFPTAKENDSEAREYLDMTNEVGQEVGCAIVVIAHSRKIVEGDDARSSLRGSSALFDAAQTIWMLDGARNRPTRCENTKERLRGKLRETFGLSIEDVIGPGPEADTLDDEWGLDVRYLSPPELQAAYAVEPGVDNQLAINAERLTTIGLRIGEILARAPHGLATHTLRGLLHSTAKPSEISAAIPILIDSGAVRAEGNGSHVVYHVGGREPGED